MEVNINIKSNSSNLSLSQTYELLQKYTLEKVKDKKTYEFNGFYFEIKVTINEIINYEITEF